MRRIHDLPARVLAALSLAACVALAPQRALADAAPGDTVDQASWEKMQGLLPDPVLNWLKKGDVVLKIGKLDYVPVWEPGFMAATEKNIGRFDLDADGGIVDAKTGKLAEQIYGWPFPKIDRNDPKAGAKIVWNKWFSLFKGNQNYFPFSVDWIGRDGFERQIQASVSQFYYQGRRDPIPNPDATELREIINVLGPAQVEGIVQLTWRFLDSRPDNVWAYAPAIRRVRQLTSANRSDPFLGSDFVNDDSSLWFGKNQSFTWKLLGEQDVYVATPAPEPAKIVPGAEWADGREWKSSPEFAGAKFGWDTPGWKGAPWAVTNMVWVKRPVFVVEGFPKDPYYSYGKHLFYVDRENFAMHYKVVFDRAGAYWKTVSVDFAPGWNDAKGDERYGMISYTQAVDDKADHASANPAAGPKNIFQFNTPRLQADMFTVDGLLRQGK